MRAAKAKLHDQSASPESVIETGLVPVARVARPFGLEGEVLVEPLTDFPDRFAPSSVLLVHNSARAILRSRRAKGRWILKLEGIDQPEQARLLQGELLNVRGSDLHPLPPGRYFRFQILGLKVFDTSGEYLGEVSDVLETGSNDVYVVTGAGGEHLVPALSDVVVEVDLEARRMVVDMPEGLA